MQLLIWIHTSEKFVLDMFFVLLSPHPWNSLLSGILDGINFLSVNCQKAKLGTNA